MCNNSNLLDSDKVDGQSILTILPDYNIDEGWKYQWCPNCDKGRSWQWLNSKFLGLFNSICQKWFCWDFAKNLKIMITWNIW